MKIAFIGAPGTGKTTVAEDVKNKLKYMGHDSFYCSQNMWRTVRALQRGEINMPKDSDGNEKKVHRETKWRKALLR